MNSLQCWKTKLERVLFSIFQYCKMTVCADLLGAIWTGITWDFFYIQKCIISDFYFHFLTPIFCPLLNIYFSTKVLAFRTSIFSIFPSRTIIFSIFPNWTMNIWTASEINLKQNYKLLAFSLEFAKLVINLLFPPSVPRKNSSYTRKKCCHSRPEQLW